MRLNSSHLWKNQVKIAIVAIAYLIIGWLTQNITCGGLSAAPIWFPAGIALTSLLIWGEKVCLGVFIGDFCLMLLLGGSWLLGLSSALGSTLSALVGARLLRLWKFSPSLGHIRDVMILVLLAALFSPTLNTTLDNFVRLSIGQLSWQLFAQQWWILWLGDCTGILLITPFLLRLVMDSRGIVRKQSPQRLIEATICIGLLLIVGWVVFGYKELGVNKSLFGVQYLEYLPFPFVVWAALRFQTWGAVTANLLLTILVLIGAWERVGPFVLQTLNLSQAVILLQVFITIITTTSLFLSAIVSERQRAERHLQISLEREHLLTEIALKIRQSLDLDQIFQTTVTEVRNFLNADRVYIGYIPSDETVKIVAESVVYPYHSLLGLIPDDELIEAIKSLLTQQDFVIADDINRLDIPKVLKEFYDKYQVKSTLIFTLIAKQKQLGLLVVHQCSRTRHWQKNEVKLLEQLATQVSIAIQQAQLYQEVQNLNTNLEEKVQKRTLELEEKMTEVKDLYCMKNVFLQAVSHDLRTSIMGLLMILKNLQNRGGDNISISRSILERIVDSSDRQLTLINALSEDHFAEQRPLVIHCQPLCLWKLVDDLLEDWQPIFRQNQIRLDNFIVHNLPKIYGDYEQICSLFYHLFTNALKHNPPGIILTLEARIEQDMIYCQLTDNGVGMDEKQCQDLFKLYVRSLHNNRLTGIGLGSYLCRQIIEAHGGKIGVNSTPGVGSQFWFTLPLAES